MTGIGTAVAIILPWSLGSPNVNATMLMSILATLLMASVVLVVLKLSYPFSGSAGLLPEPYIAFIPANTPAPATSAATAQASSSTGP